MSNRNYATPFSVLHVVSLLSHKSRISKFASAIRQVTVDTSYVIDVGTGTGILAMIAATAGARKVTAIDINRESLNYARKAAFSNGIDTNIEFIETHYEDFYPDERADVVICEMLSSIMLVEQQIPASRHAVKHLLKHDGIIIPQQVSIYAVPVEAYNLWTRFQTESFQFPSVPQTSHPDEYTDLADLAEIRHFDLIKENNEHVDEQVRYRILKEGTIHGLIGMFECQLYKDITLNMEDGWKELFIPLENPINVQPGNEIVFNIDYYPGRYDSLTVSVEN
jgi:type II protein arginine methyltransferase